MKIQALTKSERNVRRKASSHQAGNERRRNESIRKMADERIALRAKLFDEQFNRK